MVGGNHDRWGGDFWERDLGVRFDPHRLTFEHRRPAGGRDPRRRTDRSRGCAPPCSTALINHPVTAAIYRAIHPEIGLRIVDCLSPRLGDHTPDAGAPGATRRPGRRVGQRGCSPREPELGLVDHGPHPPAGAGGAEAGPAVPQSRRLVRRLPLRGGDRARRRAPARSAQRHHLRPPQPLPDEPRADLAEAGLVVAHREAVRRRPRPRAPSSRARSSTRATAAAVSSPLSISRTSGPITRCSSGLSSG